MSSLSILKTPVFCLFDHNLELIVFNGTKILEKIKFSVVKNYKILNVEKNYGILNGNFGLK